MYREFFNEYTDNEIEILVGVELDIHKEENLMEALHILTNSEKVKNEKYHSLVLCQENGEVKFRVPWFSFIDPNLYLFLKSLSS